MNPQREFYGVERLPLATYVVGVLRYDWGLNDQGAHGRNYSRVQLIFDNLFK